eukprot:scaffold7156_cov372-Ochromonas_danica.AAC.1
MDYTLSDRVCQYVREVCPSSICQCQSVSVSVTVSASVSGSVNGNGNGNGTSHTLPVNSVRALSSIANVHPLISQVWMLLRALATLPSPSVEATTERELTAHTKQTEREGGIGILVTNLVSGSSERIKRSQTTSTAPLPTEQ